VIDLGALNEKYVDVAPAGVGPTGHPLYRATHADLGRPVLLRALPRLSEGGTGEQQALFRRGARAAAGLHHQNIIQVLDYETAPDVNLLVTEYVEGELLDSLLRRRGPLPPGDAFALARQLAEALECVHQAGRVHRNLKPAEVLVTPRGQVKLGGFEAALLPAGFQDELRDEPLLGNAYFMAPEQVQGGPVGPAADQYALGVLLYQMLTGEPPVTGARGWAVLYRKTTADPPPPSSRRPGLSGDIDALVLKLLARTPGDRFADLAAFRAALSRLAAPPPTEAGPADEAIARRYPLPIAASYLRVWQDLEWVTRLNALLHLFEATLKYCAAVALLPALRAGAGRPPEDDLRALRRPSLGHWAGFLRWALGSSGAASPLAAALARAYNGTPGRARGRDVIDAAVTLRNQFSHGGPAGESAYRHAFEDLLPRLRDLLDALACLADFPLGKVLRLRYADKRFVVAYRPYMGALPAFAAAEAVVAEPVEEGRLGVFDPGRGAFVTLAPLLQARECGVCGDDEVFYYNGMRGKRLVFVSYQRNHPFDEEPAADPFAELGVSL
jgi:hypothetical protein